MTGSELRFIREYVLKVNAVKLSEMIGKKYNTVMCYQSGRRKIPRTVDLLINELLKKKESLK